MFYSLKQGMVQNDVDEVKAVRYKQKSDYAFKLLVLHVHSSLGVK